MRRVKLRLMAECCFGQQSALTSGRALLRSAHRLCCWLVHLGERPYRRAVDHCAVGEKLRAMARAIPAFFEAVPVDDAADMGADRAPLDQIDHPRHDRRHAWQSRGGGSRPRQVRSRRCCRPRPCPDIRRGWRLRPPGLSHIRPTSGRSLACATDRTDGRSAPYRFRRAR